MVIRRTNSTTLKNYGDSENVLDSNSVESSVVLSVEDAINPLTYSECSVVELSRNTAKYCIYYS
jgi:hypothetical protein